MSEERKMILQMVAEGKITPEEADKLLQAVDESEEAARQTAAESVREAGQERRAGGLGHLSDLGETVNRAVNEGLKGLDETLGAMERNLDRRLDEASRRDLYGKIEEKMRRAAESAVERATRAEERAARAAERAARQAERQAERMARFDEHFNEPRKRSRFVKWGWAVDKEKIEADVEHFSERAQAGDRLVLNNKVGDISIQFYDGETVELEVRKTVWGESLKDAQDRAASTEVKLERQGSDVMMSVHSPSQFMVFGVLWVKDTRLDCIVRVPHGLHLDVSNQVGELRVRTDGAVGVWNLTTKVGEIDVTVAPEAGFRYSARSSVGTIAVEGKQADGLGMELGGRVGDGSGSIIAVVKTGGITIHN